MNTTRKATSVRWRYPVRQPDEYVTDNRLDPDKFDVHAGTGCVEGLPVGLRVVRDQQKGPE